MLLGWIPFSIGDLFYGVAGVYLLYSLIKFLKRIAGKRGDKKYFRHVAINFITIALAVYVVFNLFWGLNYNRRGIDYQLHLDKLDYNNEDLSRVTRLVAQKMNELQPASEHTRQKIQKKKYLFGNAVSAYKNLSAEIPLISYSRPSVKPSMFSYLGNYL